MERIRESYRKNRIQFYMIVAAAVFVSLPLCTDFVNTGRDLAASLAKIRAVGAGLFHVFPLRLGPLPKTTYGYSLSVFSADVFYLFPGLLYRLGLGLQSVYKITLVCANLLTAFIAYRAFWGITEERDAAMASTVLYVWCPCRIYSIYGAGNLNEVFAWSVLPVAVWGSIRLFVQKKRDTAVLLTVGYTLLLLAWPVYFFGAAGMFVLFFLLTLRDNLTKQTLAVIVKFALAFIGVNAWYLIPMMLRMRDAGAVAPLLTEHIREYAVYLTQYVKIFAFGGDRVNVWERGLTAAEAVDPGIVVIAAVTFYLCSVFVDRQREKAIDRILIVAGILMVLSSNLVPWDMLQNKNMLFSIVLAMLQTPAKLAVPADVLLISAMGLVLSRSGRLRGWMVCLGGFLTVQFQIGRLLTIRGFLRGEQLDELSQVGYHVIEAESLFWRAAEGLSAVTVIGFLVYWCFFRHRGYEYEK